MLQYKIPQNVEREDQIISFLTFRQLGVLAAGGAVSYFFYVLLAPLFYIEVWGPLVFTPALLAACIAFIEINGVSFTKWILLFLEFTLNPRRRIWNHKNSVHNELQALITNIPQKKEENPKNKEIILEKNPKSLAQLVQEIDLEKAVYRKTPVISKDHAVELFEDEDAEHLRMLDRLQKEQKEKGAFGTYIPPQGVLITEEASSETEDPDLKNVQTAIEGEAMAIYEESMRKIMEAKKNKLPDILP